MATERNLWFKRILANYTHTILSLLQALSIRCNLILLLFRLVHYFQCANWWFGWVAKKKTPNITIIYIEERKFTYTFFVQCLIIYIYKYITLVTIVQINYTKLWFNDRLNKPNVKLYACTVTVTSCTLWHCK